MEGGWKTPPPRVSLRAKSPGLIGLRNAVCNIESEFYVLKEDIQSNTFGTKEVQLLKESMRDIEYRHKQEITLLRSQVSDLKAENLNLKETLEKIDKSQKQQFKQIGKLEREINKLQDIHAKFQSSDQQSPVNSESEQPPPSDVIDKKSIFAQAINMMS